MLYSAKCGAQMVVGDTYSTSWRSHTQAVESQATISGGEETGFEAWRGHDGSSSSGWHDGVFTGDWTVTFKTPRVVTGYSIVAGDSPIPFDLYGSNNGSAWTLLDSATLGDSGEITDRVVAAPAPFLIYRVSMNDTASGGLYGIGFSEITFAFRAY